MLQLKKRNRKSSRGIRDRRLRIFGSQRERRIDQRGSSILVRDTELWLYPEGDRELSLESSFIIM